ncbi:MAG TPA: hypothetical protein PKL73_18900 [Polyangiaceae bacterium]|nr:hypothetical protein [Polyangiaceae bacterium]HNZ24997.1 hypothetical protein [Polyangiaceae bacterium]HOD23504.1 hypothetical protein [Polyangiaceae bacterium]HOE49701.1 hypothetical protein [Polyangiaceae bacterium]HOH03058.1 hypothetical protein [Polyangiaceae bacterium]
MPVPPRSAVLLLLGLTFASCRSSEADPPPPAPAMPASWAVKDDQTYSHNQREFLEIEGRLKGRVKALRITLYEVDHHLVRLHTIVPMNSEEADKMYRILANKKHPASYLRKDEIIYEFSGPEQVQDQIERAHDLLLP